MTHRHEEHGHVARYGYRGRALTLVGLVWILVGVTVLRAPETVPILSEVLPTWTRVALWVTPGAVALVTAWWPANADRWGFMALTVPATIRAIAYAWSSFLGFTVGSDVGDPNDWIGALAWTAIVAFVLLLSAWPEPVNLTTRRPTEGAQ